MRTSGPSLCGLFILKENGCSLCIENNAYGTAFLTLGNQMHYPTDTLFVRPLRHIHHTAPIDIVPRMAVS